MNLRHLTTFVAIVESGTLTEAARRLYKTQGAVSSDLKGLEEALGLTLIDRSGQRIQLTTAGEALLPVVIDALRQVREIENVGKKVRDGALGVIRVGGLPSLGSALLDHLSEFQRRHPEVRLALCTGPQAVLRESVVRGALDLALGEAEFSNELAFDELDPERVFVVIRADDPRTDLDQMSCWDIADSMFVSSVSDWGGAPLTDEFFQPLGNRPDAVFEVEDFALMAELIRRRSGVGLMPASALVSAQQSHIAGVRPEPELWRRLGLLTAVRRPAERSVAALRAHLLESWVTPTYDSTLPRLTTVAIGSPSGERAPGSNGGSTSEPIWHGSRRRPRARDAWDVARAREDSELIATALQR